MDLQGNTQWIGDVSVCRQRTLQSRLTNSGLVESFSKFSNLCDHGLTVPWCCGILTDGHCRTDARQTTYRSNTALCIASHCKINLTRDLLYYLCLLRRANCTAAVCWSLKLESTALGPVNLSITYLLTLHVTSLSVVATSVVLEFWYRSFVFNWTGL